MIATPPPSAFSLLTMAAIGVMVMTGCVGPVMCGPCPGSRVQLTADQAIPAAGSTYEVCDGRGPCQKGTWVVPIDTGAPPAAVLSVLTVSLPGTADDYSRVTVKATVRDQAGREIGQGQATFPEYQPVEHREPCQCHNAFVELHLTAVIDRS
ncbi:hypothetical protein ABZ815_52425 [Nonomuraea sp. NPDC047529]|uniref:hypothetical protein n=1 Tax=Nonomuraea sp. NPDC047529 TaxID=3155623 RepID=UPI0033C48A9D